MDAETLALRKLFLGTAEIAVKHAGGRLRVAHNEEDQTADPQPEAAHFLKLDGKRLGRDLELYAFMVKLAGAAALADFIAEVLIRLRGELPGAYAAAAADFKTHGRAHVPPDMRDAWNKLF
jgi:hypothetical protein